MLQAHLAQPAHDAEMVRARSESNRRMQALQGLRVSTSPLALIV